MADPTPTLEIHSKHFNKDEIASFSHFNVIVFDYEDSTKILGSVEVEFCNTCHLGMRVICLHEINDVFDLDNKDGKVLICRLCGIDGT